MHYEKAQAEVERLKAENRILVHNADTAFQDGLDECRELFEPEIKAEAYKEFAERLREKLGDCHIVSDGEYCGFDCGDIHQTITNVLKEIIATKCYITVTRQE